MGIPKFKFNKPLKKDLSQLKLTDKDLESGDFAHEEIFQLKMNDVICGFFWQYDLKDYVQQDTSFEENTFIQKYGQTEWVNLFDHPFFQRRRPQIVNKIESGANHQHYYILDQGQKMGPFSIAEVKEQVKEKKAILTDMISLDDGQTWGKIYELIEFDRRNEIQSFLPHTPEREVLAHSNPEVKSKIQNKGNDATEFIAGLAYLGKKSSPLIDQEQQEAEEEEVKSKKIKYILVSVGIVTIIGSLFITFKSIDTKSTNLAGNKKVQRELRNKTRIEKVKVEKQETTSRDVNAANARIAQQRQAARRNKIRNATPFKRSKTYKNAAKARTKRFVEFKNDNDRDDRNVYDNGTDPVELDPVRRTLSKDTINPRDDEYDNLPEEEETYTEDEEKEKDTIEEEPVDRDTTY